MPAVIQFDVVIVVAVVVVIILGIDILCFGHHHLSQCAVASLVAPPPLSLNAPSPLSLRRCLYHHANACLIAPLSRQRLVVALPPLLMRRRLSCCTAASLSRCALASLVAPPPLSPHKRLSHCASLMPAVGCCIVTSLAVPVPLLSCRCLSRCAATSLVAPPPLLWRLTCAGWVSLHQLS